MRTKTITARHSIRRLARAALSVALYLGLTGAASPPPVPLEVGPGERLLVIAPHPDDETLATGGLIQRVREQGGTIRVVLVTAGDGYVEAVKHETHELDPPPRDYIAYGKSRLREARAAMRLLAGEKGRLVLLGFPDGGLDGLLRAHWWRGSPERSSTTGATDPPYAEALEPDLPYDGDDLRRELGQIVRDVQPTIIALPDPLDHHPDHRAAGLFALLATEDYVVGLPHDAPRPRLLSYLVHWPDWPIGWNAAVPLPTDTPLDLPTPMVKDPHARVALRLDDAEIATKQAAVSRYETQNRAMGGLMQAFVRRREPYHRLPASELTRVETLVEQGLSKPPKKER